MPTNVPEAVGITTATLRSQQYTDSLKRLQSLVSPRTVPAGILHTAPATLFSMARFDGIQANALRQAEWLQYYFDLHRGVLPGSPASARLPDISDLKSRILENANKSTVPIAIFNLEHHYPNKRMLVAVSSAARHDRAIRLPPDPHALLETRRGYAASALLPDRFDSFSLLPHKHTGLRVNFVVGPDFYITNTADEFGTIEADFADGFGFRTMPQGRPVTVQYQQPGSKHVRTIQHSRTGVLKGSFVFEVADSTCTVAYDTTVGVTATIPYEGKCNSGTAYVCYGTTSGTKHTKLTYPLIISTRNMLSRLILVLEYTTRMNGRPRLARSANWPSTQRRRQVAA